MALSRLNGHAKPARSDSPRLRQYRSTLRLEKLSAAGAWVETGSALCIEAAQRHASAVEGTVRALNGDGSEAARWVDGVEQPAPKESA